MLHHYNYHTLPAKNRESFLFCTFAAHYCWKTANYYTMAQGFNKFMGKGDSGAKKKERIRQEKKKVRQETKEYFEKKKH